MTDYTKSTGASGTMLIRDLGSTVEFWLNANNSTTFNHALPYNWIVNGSSGSATYNYNAGSGWQKLRTFTVTSTQTVRFGIGSTGTSGFGGPTNFDQFIDRRTVPGAPVNLALSSITATSVVLSFDDGSDGGAEIDLRQVAYGTDPAVGEFFINTNSPVLISSLTRGQTYYFWAAAHNLKGWGPWSIRASTTTLDVPEAPSIPVASNIGPVTADITFNPNGDGGSPITGFELIYSDAPDPPNGFTVPAVSPQTLYSLTPGKTYYIWARAKNSVGFGPYSAAGIFTTLAGARVNVGGVWKFAIPYVRDGGVWKIALPYTKVSGVWKQTI